MAVRSQAFAQRRARGQELIGRQTQLGASPLLEGGERRVASGPVPHAQVAANNQRAIALTEHVRLRRRRP
eukprot:8850777-Alexandrium_andersonii.AAC.1